MSQLKSARSNQKATSEGISKISVCGYKSLANECSIEVRPLTILAGANSSGKSSIMQPLLLMKQTLEAPYDPGALLIDGPNIRFTSGEQLLSKIPKSNLSDTFSIKIELDKGRYFKNTFKVKKGIELSETIYSLGGGISIGIHLDMTHEEFVATPLGAIKPFKAMIENGARWIAIRDRCFLNQTLSIDRSAIDGFNFSHYFVLFILKLIHVPSSRRNPERNYRQTAITEFAGTFDNYVASVIHDWQSRKDSKLKDLNSALTTLGLTRKIETKKIDDIQFEIRVSLTKDRISNMVSIADVGSGVSQILPVLVALIVAEAGQLVYLEEPETHLHPRAQAGLAQVLADAAQRGVRVVLETHSDLLIRRIQSLVAEDKLSPELVKLHWFSRDRDGITQITAADLDETGAFGDWPEDFSEVDLQEESRYLDAAESKLLQR